MEHFRRLGIADKLGGFPLYSQISFRTRYGGHEFGRINFETSEKSWVGPEQTRRLSQVFLEPALRQQVARQDSVQTFFGWKATGFSVSDDAVVVKLVHSRSAEERRIRARYLVGCDGRDSEIRALVGAKMVGKDGARPRRLMSRTKINYLIESDSIADINNANPVAFVWIMNKEGVGFVHQHDDKNQFLFQYQVPMGRRASEIDGRRLLARMLGEEIAFKIINEECWEGGVASVADSYRMGRVFLAGDAAHRLTPLGGFAMGTGIGDSVNLGWKLAAEFQGWAGTGLLASYGSERQETAIRNSLLGMHSADRKDLWEIPENIEDDTAAGHEARLQFGGFVEAADRQEYMLAGAEFGARYTSPIIVDPDEIVDPTSFHRYDPCDDPGGRLPQFSLGDGSYLYDHLGNYFSLIVFGDVDTSRFERSAEARHVPLKVLKFNFRDKAFERNIILVRPDTYIAWCGDEMPRDPGDIIDIVRGAVNCEI
jgi:2-polyprenyl-6-methoxyphenol hydroxylase-like FAD-dependent oxidoreductase